MDRRRILEGSALGTPIDNGQIFWNDKLYQNSRRVRSLIRDRKPISIRKLEQRIIHKIEHSVDSSVSMHSPLVVTSNAALEVGAGIIKITNGNPETTGSDLGSVFLNGRVLPTLVAGQYTTLVVTDDLSWYALKQA